MTRRILPRLLAAAATLAALVAAMTAFAGSGFAEGSAAQANYAPSNTSPPTISGTAQVGQTLTAATGGWTYQSTPTYTYQWDRCNEVGSNCTPISGATSATYVVQTIDGNDTLRVIVTATNAQGAASATSPQTGLIPLDTSVPRSTAAPAISGTAQVGQTLTASTGSWSYQSTPSYTYQWERCDTAGNNCVAASGSTSTTYGVGSADVGHTLRIIVTAHNAQGTTAATSAQTAVVGGSSSTTTTPPTTGAINIGGGMISIPASSVALPDRLIITGVQFQPSRLSSRAPFLARFRVTDTKGYAVRGALVYALGLPYSWIKNAVEVSTGQDGWASITITPSAKLPISRGHALVVFVRARVQGQDVLGGTSTRRLVQVTTAG